MKNLVKIFCLLALLTLRNNAQSLNNDLGTFQKSWQIGKNGILLKELSGDSLLFRDAADTDYLNLFGKTLTLSGLLTADQLAITGTGGNYFSTNLTIGGTPTIGLPYALEIKGRLHNTGIAIFDSTITWLGGGSSTTNAHISNTSNPHNVLASQLSDYNAVWDARLTTKTTNDLNEGTVNLYYTDARARASISETVTGLDYSSASGVLSLSTGYVIPTTTEETNWNDAYSKRVDTWSAPLTFSANVVSLTQNGDILGTANQVNVTGGTNILPGTNNVTLSLPQDIATTSNVQFNDIASTGNVGSNSYASRTTGWRADANGNADFRTLYADQLHAKSFIADLDQAIASGEIISKSVAKIYSDFAMDNSTSWDGITTAVNLITTTIDSLGARQLIVESFSGYPTLAVFGQGDLIRLRYMVRSAGSLTITDAWGKVYLDESYGASGFNSTSKTQAYSFYKIAGSDVTVQSGALALDYGGKDDGIIEMVAYDGNNAPYIDVKSWDTNPYTDLTVKMRSGKVSGLTNPVIGSLKGFGVAINPTSSTDYFIYDSTGLYIAGDGSGLDITANSTITSIQGDVTTNSTNISVNSSNISLKANSTTTDSLRSRIVTNESGISVNSDSVNIFSTRTLATDDSITVHRTEINTNSSNITLKASTSVMNDSLSAHFSLISVNTDSIGIISSRTVSTQDSITALRSGITVNSDSVSIFSTRTLATQDSITAHRSSIDVNATDITLRVLSTSFVGDTLVSKINIADTSIKIESEQIEFKGSALFRALNGNNTDSTTINGGKITAKTITADQINVSTLVADSITSGTFTGLTFQTATSGKRIVIDGTLNELNFYDSSNENIVNIGGGTNGDISLKNSLGGYTIELYGSDGHSFFDGSIQSNGNMILSSQSKIIFGGDVNLYATIATNILTTDYDFDALTLRTNGTERIDASGNATFGAINGSSIILTGNIKTANPGSGAGNWELGTSVSTSGLTLSTTNYIEVRINGTIYKLAVVN